MNSSAISYFNLESARLQFRALTEDHIEDWSTFFIDNDKLHFFNLTGDIDPMKESRIWIERQIHRYKTQNLGLLAVLKKDTLELIGICGLIPREFDSGSELEIGYSFIPAFWGNGFATEAAILMKSFAKENKLAERVVSMIHPENLASQAVAKRNGMMPAFKTTYENTPVIVFVSQKFNT